jgi:hypothetical protein
MKTYRKFLSRMIIIVLIAGCADELELKNPNEFTTDLFWQTDNDFLQGLAATYKVMDTPWHGGYWGIKGVEIQNGRGDDMFIRNDVPCLYALQSFTNDPTCQEVFWVFRELYDGIFRANQVIEAAVDAPISDASKTQYAAEAIFLRGMFHFDLVINFGSVPIRTEVPGTRDEYFKASSPEADVWAQIISDLKDAQAGLKEPAAYPPEYVGRATKGAAIGFLGKAYLYYAQYDQSYFALAETELAKLLSPPYTYELMENYGDNFKPEFDNNKESLLECEFQHVGGTGPWQPNGVEQSLGTAAGKEFGPEEVGCWFEMYPTNKVFDEFMKEKTVDDDVDPRAYSSIVWEYPGSLYYNMPYDTVNFPNEYKFKCRIRKYLNWWNNDEMPVGLDQVSEINEKALRFADILLIYAEALTMQDKVSEAYAPINRIRQRAHLADLPAGYNRDQMMAEIRHQRMIEFFREGQRFYDLKRWGLLEQEIKNDADLDKPGHENFEYPKNEYYPIPQVEIDANPNIVQNPNW